MSGCGGSLAGNTYTTGSITVDCTVSATFAIDTYTLSVVTTGKGTGTVTSSDGNIDCPELLCSYVYDYGTVLTLTAMPAASSSFTQWMDDCSGTTDTCLITVDGDKTVTAEFYYFPWPSFMPAIIH